MTTLTKDHSVDDPSRGLGRTRTRVLSLIQDASGPVSVDDVAERMGLHRNTARFHLEALEATNLVLRSTDERRQPGRPRALYQAAPGTPDVAQRSYRFLAEVLTSFVANRMPEPAESAEEAGAVWGRYLAEPTPPFHRVDTDEAVAALVGGLGEVGFESHPEGQGDELRLEISHCPFLEVALDHREIVCSIHLGLMRGMLEGMGAGLAAESLEPLVEPSRCIAHLRPTTSAG